MDFETPRNATHRVHVGNVPIGGGAPVSVQSMTNAPMIDGPDGPWLDVEGNLAQIGRLTKAGCEIVRVAIPNRASIARFGQVALQSPLPVVADVHFDYQIAMGACHEHAAGLRINPGNIGSIDRVKAVVEVAKERNIPIRVGVNSGSLEKDLVDKYHGVTAEGIVESALDKVHIIEDLGYDNLVISIKSSDVLMCVAAHEKLVKETNYPLHVGITESGTIMSGNIKSSI